jgi:hypothetical protein
MQKRWPDASLARCEQTIMLGFYSIRKLIDSRKLTIDFASEQVKVTTYRPTGKHVHMMNCRNLDELYDFNSGKFRTVTLKYLCHQIIHSYVFGLIFDESNRFTSIVVSSEQARLRELLEVDVAVITTLFERAGKGEDDEAISIRYNNKQGDYVVRLRRFVETGN